jgi:hypothetical protein
MLLIARSVSGGFINLAFGGKNLMNALRKSLAVIHSYLVASTLVGGSAYASDESSSQTPVTSALPSPQEVQQLVAPIDLYPDSLVAQILAALTYTDRPGRGDRSLAAGASRAQGEELSLSP